MYKSLVMSKGVCMDTLQRGGGQVDLKTRVWVGGEESVIQECRLAYRLVVLSSISWLLCWYNCKQSPSLPSSYLGHEVTSFWPMGMSKNPTCDFWVLLLKEVSFCPPFFPYPLPTRGNVNTATGDQIVNLEIVHNLSSHNQGAVISAVSDPYFREKQILLSLNYRITLTIIGTMAGIDECEIIIYFLTKWMIHCLKFYFSNLK